MSEMVGGRGRGGDDGDPSALEIVQFARYLGMDPIEDCAFLWIAEQALVAPLPDDWSEHMDAEGNVYYYNVVTDASSWEHPMDQYYRNLFLKVKKEHDNKREKEEAERLREEQERQAAEEDAKRAEEERELARTRSALLIQRNYRGLMGRKQFRKRMDAVEENQKHRAATSLQAAWRGQFVRKYVAQYRDEIEAARREEAVVTIQARHRGRKGRRNAMAHKKRADARKRDNAAVMIQSHVRRRAAYKVVHGRRCHRSATTIQAGWRGSKARKHTNKLRIRKQRNEAATKIQANYRMVRLIPHPAHRVPLVLADPATPPRFDFRPARIDRPHVSARTVVPAEAVPSCQDLRRRYHPHPSLVPRPHPAEAVQDRGGCRAGEQTGVGRHDNPEAGAGGQGPAVR